MAHECGAPRVALTAIVRRHGATETASHTLVHEQPFACLHLRSCPESPFYEHFRDKEECYLAAYEESVSATLEAVAQGISGAENWLSRVRGSLRAYLRRVVDNPQTARAFIVEVLAAGERASEQRERVHRRFSDFLRAARVQAGQELELPELPDEVFEVMVGGIEHVVAHEIRRGRGDRLMALEQPLLYFQIAVFAGHAHAKAAMQCGSDGAP